MKNGLFEKMQRSNLIAFRDLTVKCCFIDALLDSVDSELCKIKKYFHQSQRCKIFLLGPDVFNFLTNEIHAFHGNWQIGCSNKYGSYILFQDDPDSNEFEGLVKVIVHECVHVLEMHCSTEVLHCNTWLYESIATYLANQIPKTKPSDYSLVLSDLENCFYNLLDCYSYAYYLGKAYCEMYGLANFNFVSSQHSVLVDLCDKLAEQEPTLV